MKHIALAFLLLPLLLCQAAETADELFRRSTVRNPDFILCSSTPKDYYTDEVLANIDKSAELLRYQMDFGLGLNPSTFFTDIAKARPEKLLVTAVYSPDDFQETFGIDFLLALKTIRPMNAQLFIGGIQMLATIMQSPKPTINDTGISAVFGTIPLTLQFCADNTILLLGRTSTVSAIKEGKSDSFTFPQNIEAPFFMTASIPPALTPKLAEILPDDLPPELSQLSRVILTINHNTLLSIGLVAVFPTNSNAEAIANQLGQLREQVITLCKDEPTLSRYLQKTDIATQGNLCRVTCELPWQVVVGSIPASMLLPALSTAREKAHSISCVNNLKQLALMMLMYATDHDDMLPAADTWEKDIKEYYGEGKLLFCPAAPEHKYIYYGRKLKMSDIQTPSRTILISEDIGNHAQRHTVNISFVDGHVESVQVNGEATIEEIAEKHHFEFIR